jgi:hypothetical protein
MSYLTMRLESEIKCNCTDPKARKGNGVKIKLVWLRELLFRSTLRTISRSWAVQGVIGNIWPRTEFRCAIPCGLARHIQGRYSLEVDSVPNSSVRPWTGHVQLDRGILKPLWIGRPSVQSVQWINHGFGPKLNQVYLPQNEFNPLSFSMNMWQISSPVRP